MNFISTPDELQSIFLQLCKKFSHYEWCVAWAGREDGHHVFKYLASHEEKIEKLIVGLHFYQTDPLFIEHYMSHRNVRFVMSSEGTFHPKIYLFYNSEEDWAVIIGSSNLTQHGLSINTEANVLVTSNDAGVTFFDDVTSFIDQCWDNATAMSASDLAVYKEHHDQLKGKLKVLRTMTSDKRRKLTSAPICYWEWNDYANKVKSGRGLRYRIELLKQAHDIFARYPYIEEVDYEDRRKLAGFVKQKEGELDWQWFGSTKPFGVYMSAVNNLFPVIKAIDDIPLDKEISKEIFKEYASAYSKYFGKDTLACATRLLAMKRPDVFICVNSKNKKLLCESLGIPQKALSLETYWDYVIEPIMNSQWYCTPVEGLSIKDKSIYKYRVALLDSAFYNYY